LAQDNKILASPKHSEIDHSPPEVTQGDPDHAEEEDVGKRRMCSGQLRKKNLKIPIPMDPVLTATLALPGGNGVGSEVSGGFSPLLA
jgi:hypothetical protein